MTDIVGSFTTELRITGRIFRETFLGIRRTGWMNVIILVTMASILSIFGVLMAVVIQMSALVHNVGSEMEISAYLKNGTDAHVVEQDLLNLPHLKRVTLVTKEKAWADWQKDYPLPDIQNPLPDTLHIQLTSENYIPETVQKLKLNPQIATIQYAKRVLDRIRSVTQGASLVGIVVSLFLGMLTLFIISNTIHLLIQAKSREIEILRMMGVGNWYIRFPFLIQGSLYGLIGALVAYIPLSAAVYYSTQFLSYIGFPSNEMTLGYVTTLLVFMGVLVGAGGAAIAVHKYLHI